MMTAKEARMLMPIDKDADQKLIDIILMQLEMQISNVAYKGRNEIKDVFGVFVFMTDATLNAVLNQLRNADYTLIDNGIPGPKCNPDYTLIW